MGRHHGRQLRAQARERHQVICANLFQAAFIIGDGDVGIGLSPTVAREVFAGGGHAGTVHATNEGACQQSGALGVAFERTRADYGAALVVQVQHRGEAQVEADRQHFSCHDPAALFSQVLGIRLIRQ